MPFDRLLARWSEAWETNDLNKLVDCYADDAVIMHPKYAAAQGKAEIRKFFDGALGTMKVEFVPEKRLSSDTVGWEWGQFRDLDLTTGSLISEGQYTMSYVITVMGWRIMGHTWNEPS